MAIKDAELLAEIQADPVGLGLAGAGSNAVFNRLNAPGSALVDAWIVSPQPKRTSKEVFLQKISSIEEAAWMQRTKEGSSDLGTALRFYLSESVQIDMGHPVSRGFVALLTASDDVPGLDKPLKKATADAILRLGEVLQSRSYELWNEEVSLSQVKTVRGRSHG